ncbi:MAG TPA: SDR family oxidoreductase [Allosphingosinicella sp.]|jgi:2'-hydroxyisoflavone reductase
MRILILGGTLFLGRALAEAALERGHEVTLFNRGRNREVSFPGVENLIGDRDGGLDALSGRSWDSVVDTSGYLPRLVRDSARLLAGQVERYVFISSISVYADFSRPTEEGAPLATMPDETLEEVTGSSYGPLKALCERAVEEAMPGRALVIRPGLIVGPHDPTVRFSYWTARSARGGEALAPGEPDSPVQLIDVRDLAEWIVRMIEDGGVGTFNASGPGDVLTMGALLETCRAASGGGVRFTWVDEAFLIERGVRPWSELPLWLPESSETHRYFHRAAIGRALAAGLTFRPLADTVRATLDWQRASEGRPLPEKSGVAMPDVTLRPEREAELLDEWHRRRG